MKTLIAILLTFWAFALQGQLGQTDKREDTKEATAQSALLFISPYAQTETYNQLTAQVNIWKKKVDAHPTNADSWLNYYMVSRLWFLQSNQYTLSNKAKEQLRQIAEGMLKQAEGDQNTNFGKQLVQYFEQKDYNYTKATQYLLAAYKAEPNNKLLFAEMAQYHEIQGNTQQRNEFCNKIEQVGNSTALYHYSLALVESLANGAILFTNGEYDTYAVWRAAAAKGKNIKVISNTLLQRKEYRDAIIKRYGLKNNPYNSKNHTKYIGQLADLNSNTTIYMALTLPKNIVSSLEGKLYNTGFAYKYSKTEIDNILELYTNLITQKVNPQGSEKQVYKNLLQGYITLYRHYKKNNAATATQIHQKAKEFGTAAGFWGNKYEEYFK